MVNAYMEEHWYCGSCDTDYDADKVEAEDCCAKEESEEIEPEEEN